MIYFDPTDTLSAELAPLALMSGHELLVCADSASVLAALHGPNSHPALVLSVVTKDNDPGISGAQGLALVREVRKLAHRQALPILLTMDQRDLALAAQALREGVTEVFLAEDQSAIREMAMRYLDLPVAPAISGHALVVEDNPLFVELISDECRTLGLTSCACASVDEALALMVAQEFQLAVIDIVLDGLQSGLALVRHIRGQNSATRDLPILVVSGFNDTARRLEALRNGADDYLEKPFASAELIWRLRRILPERTEALDGTVNDIASAEQEWQHKNLSNREMEISAAIVRGMTDKQIAEELGISFWTVRSHIGHLFTKLGVLNRRELLTRYLPKRNGNGAEAN